MRGRELIDAIASIDENGPRLIANYEHAFPELMAGIRAFGTELEPVDSESLGWLLAACSLLVDCRRRMWPGCSGRCPAWSTWTRS